MTTFSKRYQSITANRIMIKYNIRSFNNHMDIVYIYINITIDTYMSRLFKLNVLESRVKSLEQNFSYQPTPGHDRVKRSQKLTLVIF